MFMKCLPFLLKTRIKFDGTNIWSQSRELRIFVNIYIYLYISIHIFCMYNNYILYVLNSETSNVPFWTYRFK